MPTACGATFCLRQLVQQKPRLIYSRNPEQQMLPEGTLLPTGFDEKPYGEYQVTL
jgi:hypothetical protein